ncbi:MAG TPA: hypothetical protein VEF04_11970, partial [Blastocatellia bacterium]|nr:hypothetical protein [Blastocatellia bacterium]
MAGRIHYCATDSTNNSTGDHAPFRVTASLDANGEAVSATNGDLLETSAATKQNLYSQRAITEVEREEMIVVIRDVFEANGTLKTEDAVRAVARK